MLKGAAETQQVIVSTQSVELLNHFQPENVVVVRREGDASVFKRLDTEELADWLADDYSLGELWQRNVPGREANPMRRVVVVCEGETEENFVRDVLAPGFYGLGLYLEPQIERLLEIPNAAASPEHINDRPETKPAAHLERELSNPSYRKRRHGPVAAQKIGLAKMEAECAFFAAWLQRIRELAQP